MRIKLGAVAVAGFLVLLCAVITAGAMASKGLVLNSENQGVLAAGVEVDLQLALLAGESNCDVDVSGSLISNGMPKDAITAGETELAECVGSPSATVTAGSWNVSLSASGKAKLTASSPTVITEAGPCVYAFTKFSGTIPIPGSISFLKGAITAKLDKVLSSKSCAKTSSRELLWSLTASQAGRKNSREIETTVSG